MMENKKRFLRYFEILALSWDSADSWYDVSLQDTDGFDILDGDQDVNWKLKGFGNILDVIIVRRVLFTVLFRPYYELFHCIV